MRCDRGKKRARDAYFLSFDGQMKVMEKMARVREPGRQEGQRNLEFSKILGMLGEDEMKTWTKFPAKECVSQCPRESLGDKSLATLLVKYFNDVLLKKNKFIGIT